MFRYINLFLKRIMDILGSLLGIIILSPLFIIISISIKVDSKGPVFFRQERLGKNGKVFKILKFRTMIVNAEKIGDGIMTSETDYRITKVGRFLRKTSLDEIPQLINVLIGTMSLVGPRPPVKYHPYKYEDYSEEQLKRFIVKPGITGLSQVKVRNSVSWDERIIYDVIYVEENNVFKDVLIIIRTILSIFKNDSIYKE